MAVYPWYHLNWIVKNYPTLFDNATFAPMVFHRAQKVGSADRM